jgi:four helix bundle protein
MSGQQPDLAGLSLSLDELTETRHGRGTAVTDERPVRDYRDLQVWRKGMLPAKKPYHLTRKFPGEEQFGLISQMRRAPVSILCNIAEGRTRHTSGGFNHFSSQAEGFTAELDTQILLGIPLEFCRVTEAEDILPPIVEIRRRFLRLGKSCLGRTKCESLVTIH